MENFKIRRYQLGFGSKKALLIFPHWGCSAWPYKLLALAFPGFRRIVYQYSSSLLNSDIKFTADNFAKFERAISVDVKRLKAEGVESFGFHATSLGTVIAAKSAKSLADIGENISHIILNLSAASFPCAVWHGRATRETRDGLVRRGIGYMRLEREWGFLSPINNLAGLKKETKILFFASLEDNTMEKSNVDDLIVWLKKNCPNAEFHFNVSLGHRWGGIKNMLRVRIVKKFLES